MGGDALNTVSATNARDLIASALRAVAGLGVAPSAAGINLGSPKNSRGKKDDDAALDVGGGLSSSDKSNQMVAVAQDTAEAPSSPSPSSVPLSVSDAVRSGISTPFSAANMADPAAALASSSGKDVLAQLGDIRVSPETIKLARSLGNLIGDAHPQLPSAAPTMALPRGRAHPVPPPKKAPAGHSQPRRALALSGAHGRLQQQQVRQLLLQLLGSRGG